MSSSSTDALKFIDKLDFDLDDISGNVTSKGQQVSAPTQPPVQKPKLAEKERTFKSPHEASVYRLSQHCDRTWFTVMNGSELMDYECGHASGEEFLVWLKQAFPLANTGTSDSSVYDPKDVQTETILNVCRFYENIRYIFKKFGGMPEIPQLKKTQKEKA